MSRRMTPQEREAAANFNFYREEDEPLFQCDACGKLVPKSQIKPRVAYGIEGDFCATCRGEESE